MVWIALYGITAIAVAVSGSGAAAFGGEGALQAPSKTKSNPVRRGNGIEAGVAPAGAPATS